MPDLTILKSVAVVATRLGLSLYDKPSAAQDIGMFAQTVNRSTRQKTLHLEWWDAFPLMRKWIGDRQTFKGYKSGIDVTVEPYELTFKLDLRELDLDGDRSLIQGAQDIGTQFGNGFTNGRFIFAYAPIRANQTTTYDDQNLFDTDHVHPDGETFSNIIDISDDSRIADRATSGFPTALEAQAELEAAIETLERNRLRNVSVVELGKPPLVVIVKSFGTWKGYNELLTRDTLAVAGGTTTNTWKGAFRLVRDFEPVSGDEKKVDVILAEPNGPRPVVFVPARNPGPLEVDTKWVFDRKEAYYGSDADYGFAAALPHPVVRIQE
jgi:hypothetical protein